VERIYKAFWNSMAGFSHAIRTEKAVTQEAGLLLLAIPLAFFVGAGLWQRVALVSVVLLIMAVELLNTCVEKLCDHVTPELHPQIKVVKDMGSSAVFCTLVIAGMVWLAALAERLSLL
jgi:diacylglycerol kinase (ATP)